MHACPSISDDCIRACASINMEASYPEHRVGMIDSGCNETVFKHDQEMRQKCIDFNQGESTMGSDVSSEYCTDGSATATLAVLHRTPILRANNNIRPKLLSVHIFGTFFK
jgi:hypothetical protein